MLPVRPTFPGAVSNAAGHPAYTLSPAAICGLFHSRGEQALRAVLGRLSEPQEKNLFREALVSGSAEAANLIRQCGRPLSHDVSGINLSGLNLDNVNLSNCRLANADLRNANLANANLEEADLESAVLDNAVLCGANLRSCMLTSARFNRANLSDANLSNVMLGYAVMNDAALRNAHLSGSVMNDSSFRNADLTDAELCHCDCTNTDFSEAIFQGAELSGADLMNAQLTGADLTSAVMENITIRGTDFSGAKLDVDTLLLFLDADLLSLDLEFDHFNNEDSYLTAISSIDDEYISLKINLLHQIIDYVEAVTQQNANISVPRRSFIETLGKQPELLGDARIHAFVRQQLENEMVMADQTVALYGVVNSHLRGRALLESMQNVLDSLMPEEQDRIMLEHNGFFNQLMLCHLNTQDNPQIEIAQQSYEHYLALPVMEPYVLHADFGDMQEEGRPEWSDTASFNLLLRERSVGREYVMMLSQDVLTRMFNTEPECWGNHYLFVNGELQSAAEIDRTQLFTQIFPLLSGPFATIAASSRFVKLFDALQLGDYEERFRAALSRGSAGVEDKLVDSSHQLALGETFRQVMDNQDPPRLRAEHAQTLEGVFSLHNKSEQFKSAALFCLSALFCRYSSSHFFGTETESPQILRNYAYALLEKSREFNPDVMSQHQFNDWSDKLLGRNNAFTCTALLSDEMVTHARDTFPHILRGLYPPAWG